MAADGLLSYRTEITDNYAPPRMARAETNLMDTVAKSYQALLTYRRLAEEHLDMTLDEFLGASQSERLPFDDHGAEAAHRGEVSGPPRAYATVYRRL